jgi:hypothetical protein
VSRGDEPRGTPSTRAGVEPLRPQRDATRTEQLESEIEQEHEESALDRDGEVRPERPVNSRRSDGTADQAGIETDHEKERPQD